MAFWDKFRRKKKDFPYRFTNAESFRFLTEGLANMQEWSRTGNETKYLAALWFFEQSVEKYPQDLIGRFYRACMLAQKSSGRDQALADWRIVLERAPNTDLAAYAQSNINALSNFQYPEGK